MTKTRTIYYTDLPEGFYRADVSPYGDQDRFMVQILPNRGPVATEAMFDTFEAASEALDRFLDWTRGGQQLPPHPVIGRFYASAI